MSDRAGSKVGLEVMPITSMTLSDGHRPGERAPTRRYLKPVLFACRFVGAIGRTAPDRDDLRTSLSGG
jgi:hypothetical protein